MARPIWMQSWEKSSPKLDADGMKFLARDEENDLMLEIASLLQEIPFLAVVALAAAGDSVEVG